MTLDIQETLDFDRDPEIRNLRRRLGLETFRAIMGDSDLDDSRPDEPGRKGIQRVRIIGDQVPFRRVKSGMVGGYSPRPGHPVIVGYDRAGALTIKETDWDSYTQGGGNPLIYNTGDSRISGFTSTAGLVPLWCGAVGTENTPKTEVAVNAFRFLDVDGNVQWFQGERIDLASFIPASGFHRYVAIFLDLGTLSLEATGSTPKVLLDPLTLIDKQECYSARTPGSLPIWLWTLKDGQTEVTSANKTEDLREWLNIIPADAIMSNALFPNPVDTFTVVPQGKTVMIPGTLVITDTLVVEGTLAVLGDDSKINSKGVTAAHILTSGVNDEVQIRVQGNSSQTENLQEWENGEGTILHYVDPGAGVGKGAVFGEASIGTAGGSPTAAAFSHKDFKASGVSYAFAQLNDGTTFINAATAKTIRFLINAVEEMRLDSNGNLLVDSTTLIEPFAGFTAQGNAVIQLYEGTSTSTNTKYSSLNLVVNQTGTTNFAGTVTFVNAAIGAAGKQLGQLVCFTDGATDQGVLSFVTYDSGVVVGLLGIHSDGRVGIITQAPSALLHIDGRVDEIQLIVEGHSSQSANIVEVHNNASAVLMSVSNLGKLTIDNNLAVNGGAITSTSPITITSTGNTTIIDTLTVSTIARVGINAPTPGAILDIEIPDALSAVIGLIVRGAATQTANLIEMRDTSDNILIDVTPLGHLEIHDNKELRFFDDGANFVGFEAPALSADQIWILPAADGTEGDRLETDGAGNLSWETSHDHAELYRNSAGTLTITTPNQFYPGLQFTTGDLQGIIIDQGEAGAITQIVQNGSDITVSANNTLAVGDPVSLNDGTGYDGLYMVTVATATTFDVTAAFVADGTGVYIKGDNMVIAKTGEYAFSAFFSGLPVTGAPVFEFAVAINATLSNKGRPQRKFSNATDVGNSAGSQLLDLVAADRVTFLARNTSGTQNLSITQANVNIRKI